MEIEEKDGYESYPNQSINGKMRIRRKETMKENPRIMRPERGAIRQGERVTTGFRRDVVRASRTTAGIRTTIGLPTKMQVTPIRRSRPEGKGGLPIRRVRYNPTVTASEESIPLIRRIPMPQREGIKTGNVPEGLLRMKEAIVRSRRDIARSFRMPVRLRRVVVRHRLNGRNSVPIRTPNTLYGNK